MDEHRRMRDVNQFLAFLGTDAHLPDVPQISVSAVFYPKDIVSKIDLPGLKLPAVRRRLRGMSSLFWFVMVILGKNGNNPKKYIDIY